MQDQGQDVAEDGPVPQPTPEAQQVPPGTDITNDEAYPLAVQDIVDGYEGRLTAAHRENIMLEARLKGSKREIEELRRVVIQIQQELPKTKRPLKAVADARTAPKKSGSGRKRS